MNTSRRTNSRRFVITATIAAGLLTASGCSKVKQFTARPSTTNSDVIASSSPDMESSAVKLEVAPTTPTEPQFIATGFVDQSPNAGYATASGHSNSTQMLPIFRSSPATASVRKTTCLRTLQPGENLDELLKNTSGLVLVDFYADWCGPCRRQGKILHDMESFAAQNNATIIKVNVDKHQQLATKYRVSSLPTLLAMKRGNLVNRRTGLADQHQIQSLLRM